MTGDERQIRGLYESLFASLSADDSPEASPKLQRLALVDPQGCLRGVHDAAPATLRGELLRDLRIAINERVEMYHELVAPPWMNQRRAKQLAAGEAYEVFHGFAFTDEVIESGITFRNRIVDDSGRRFVPAHYDHGNGVAVADVNGDGLDDVYFANQVGANQLWKNLGDGKFEDITSAAGVGVPDRISVTASFADIDNDGDSDLYVTTVRGGNLMFQNDGAGVFSDITKAAGLDYNGHSSAALFFDYDRDGLLDLFLVNVGVYTTDKIATVENDSINAETFWPWGLSVGDLNADGFEDLFVAGFMTYPYRYAVNSLLLNDRGRGFLDSEFVLGAEPRRAKRSAAPWFELDAAGKDAEHPIVKSRTKEEGINEARYVVWGAIGSRSSVIFDLDNDGDLDVITNDFNSEPMVLVSDLAERNPELRYLRVKLRGTRSNRDGLGAIVRVTTPTSTYTKAHDGKSGYLSQSSLPLYFGLGAEQHVDRIEITWPSGTQQVVDGPLESNQTLTVEEAAGASE